VGLIIFLVILAALILYAISIYNNLVNSRNRVGNAFSQIDVQLTRRYDLIPNLVEAVKGYMGHERFTPYAAMLEKHPERVIEKAVYGMLPKTALGRQSLRRKLRVFANANHTHAAQQPKVLDLKKKSETK